MSRDYHARALQTYRVQKELARANTRDAMVRGDRRDLTIMGNAEADRHGSAKLRPRERVEIDLCDLREFDRARFPRWQ